MKSNFQSSEGDVAPPRETPIGASECKREDLSLDISGKNILNK